MSSFSKTIFRMFLSNKGRFIANFLIVLLSVAITSGLGSLPKAYEDSFSSNYENVPDLIIKTKKEEGFSDFSYIEKDEEVDKYESLVVMDLGDETLYRIYIRDFQNMEIDPLEIIDGREPETWHEVVAEQGNFNRLTTRSGNVVVLPKITMGGMVFENFTLLVSGVSDSGLYNSVAKERAMVEGDEERYISAILYFDKNTLPSFVLDSFVTTDVYITFKDVNDRFAGDYNKRMKEKAKEYEEYYGEDNVIVLTLEENNSYALFKGYNDKVHKISIIFPVFFIVVCALVNLITITRLISDERALIGVYVSLGVEPRNIVTKYALFSISSVFLGAMFGFALGIPFVPKVVYPAYQAVFEMGSLGWFSWSWVGLISALAILAATAAVTIFSAKSRLKETPASIMKPEAPKPGKKIFLEKITAIWNKLPFRFKSSFRNIFRQKKNTILTSLSVIGSTLLVAIGFSLLDVSEALQHDELFANVASSMSTISAVVIIFAIAMCGVVVYSLANMNIVERKRELATLKVLGYFDPECSMYTFREIMIISSFSSLIGLPISAGVIAFVFSYLGFGTIGDVKAITYIASFLIVIGTTIVINALLFRKIKNVDMNDSLKILE